MHADKDFLRLEAENRALRDRLSALGDTTGEMMLKLAELLAPTPRQQPEVRVVLRVLASQAGMPSLCKRRECRRKGACLAEGSPPACWAHWSGGLRARFGDIALGMEVTAFRHRQEDADFHAWACEQLGLSPDGEAPSGKHSRKAARLNARPN